MAHFLNDDLEYVVDDYYDVAEFEEDPFSENHPHKNGDADYFDSDFEDDFDSVSFISFNFNSIVIKDEILFSVFKFEYKSEFMVLIFTEQAKDGYFSFGS